MDLTKLKRIELSPERGEKILASAQKQEKRLYTADFLDAVDRIVFDTIWKKTRGGAFPIKWRDFKDFVILRGESPEKNRTTLKEILVSLEERRGHIQTIGYDRDIHITISHGMRKEDYIPPSTVIDWSTKPIRRSRFVPVIFAGVRKKNEE